MITELKPSQIFVFGSNDLGSHGAGAAKLAFDKFGALWGVARGPQGQSYAIATLNVEMHPHLLIEIKLQIEQLYEVAIDNPHKEFLMTWIGCGIAGFKKSEIAPLLKGSPKNVILPEDYEQVIQTKA